MGHIPSRSCNLSLTDSSAYRSLNLGPGDVPFELRPSHGKGWGAFATRKITPGDLIFEERPLFAIRKPLKHITEFDVRAGFQRLSPHKKQQFLCLLDNGTRPFTSMEKAFKENCFCLAAHPLAHGLFVILSRFNNSCIPNCKTPHEGLYKEQLQVYATRVIMPGEELTICYLPDLELRTAGERTQRLRFQCHCKACSSGTSFKRISDMRRTLLRGLHYLTHGEDVDGLRPVSERPILNDPQVRRAAEELRIPLSTRLIAHVLRGFLLEEEGLLDHLMVERILPGVRVVAASFRTPSNARMAAIVVAQKSWLGKVCAAFRLYGKEDDGDQEVAAELRMAREAERL